MPKKEILKYLGIFIGGIIVSWIFLVLISMGGARRIARTPSITTPGISPLEAPFVEEKTIDTGSVSLETPSRLVIKTGNLNLVVRNVSETAKKIIQYTEEKGGWVVNSSISEVKEVPSGTITVRIPSEIFEDAIEYFKKLAEKVSFEGRKAEDVTEEYVDLQSRLRNLEATEAQLLEIMKRSGTISEVLSVQRELTTVREQIEKTKGRIQYLEKSAKMASLTINLALSEELLPIPPAEKWRPIYVMKKAWRSAVGSLRGISYLLIWIIVYGIIWIPLMAIILGIRKFLKKKKKNKQLNLEQ